MNRVMTIAILAMLAGGCSAAQDGPKKTLTERQRDSVLSRTDLPGADVVGRAMRASDVEARRATRMDAAVDSLPH